MRLNLEALPTDIPLLHKIIREMVDSFSQEALALREQLTSLKEQLTKLRAQLHLSNARTYGVSSEKLERFEDVERLGDLEEFAKEDSESNERTISKSQPKRQKLPDHLPRVEIIHDVNKCSSCGGDKLKKISDDTYEILEYIKARFKVIKHVRPRCICTQCDHITQSYPVSYPIDKGIAGPGLLAHVMTQKYCYHLPLYRQVKMYGTEGVELSRSTMAGWMFYCGVVLMPLIQRLADYVLSSTHIHGDDTPIKVLSPGLNKTKVGRIWTYVVDGRSYGGESRPAVCYRYSPDRKGSRPLEHLENFKGVLHADAYAGYNGVYERGGVTEAGCWAHTRRKFYEVTVVSDQAKVAYNALKSIQDLYGIEADVRGKSAEIRLEHRQKRSKEIVEKMFAQFERDLKDLPKKSGTALAINYALNNKVALYQFLEDGKIEIDNNIAERALRGVAVGRKNWLFAGSDRGGHTAAAMFSLIESAKLNNLDPEKYLAHVLGVIQDYNAQKLDELLPWNIKIP